MLQKMAFIVILILSISFLGFSLFNTSYKGDSKYVGIKTCGMCHKKENVGQQLIIWQESRHAQAYKTLQTEEADKIAKEKGFTTKAVDTPECLKCHAS
jgi:uncharacterized protein YxeA